MKPDDTICFCHKVTLTKIKTYLRKKKPPVPSLLSECMGAGTSCGWCIKTLKELHTQHLQNIDPHINISKDEYKENRVRWKTKNRKEKEKNL